MNVPISGCATLEGLHRKTKTNFERFVRATNCDYQFEGAGLGLSIVQAIAQAHGGWVELFSRLGHGSTFTTALFSPGRCHP